MEPIAPAPEVSEERAKRFGRIDAYDPRSHDWVEAMALVEKLYPDYKH